MRCNRVVLPVNNRIPTPHNVLEQFSVDKSESVYVHIIVAYLHCPKKVLGRLQRHIKIRIGNQEVCYL